MQNGLVNCECRCGNTQTSQKNVLHTTHKAILHASCVQRQTLGMSDIEPAAKPQLGPLAACNRFAPLAPAKRNV